MVPECTCNRVFLLLFFSLFVLSFFLFSLYPSRRSLFSIPMCYAVGLADCQPRHHSHCLFTPSTFLSGIKYLYVFSLSYCTG